MFKAQTAQQGSLLKRRQRLSFKDAFKLGMSYTPFHFLAAVFAIEVKIVRQIFGAEGLPPIADLMIKYPIFCSRPLAEVFGAQCQVATDLGAIVALIGFSAFWEFRTRPWAKAAGVLPLIFVFALFAERNLF